MASQNQGQFETASSVTRVKMLLNKNLINICKDEKLSHSGVKMVLQSRIIGQLENYAREGNLERFNRLKNSIHNPDSANSPTSSRFGHSSHGGGASSHSHHHHTPSKHANRPSNQPTAQSSTPRPIRLNFKSSPFHTILESLTPIVECPVMDKNRYNVDTTLKLQRLTVDRLKADATLRIMVYCAADNGLGAYTKLDIAFPHQVELKVNSDDVKANLRGLKNKPGSTRPADITHHLHKTDKYQNIVSLGYALTQKKFHYVVNLVKTHPVEELVKRLRVGRVITKASVIREMVAKSQDPDIVATSTVMSLKCPLSTLRMELPTRSTVCTHIQCFDASSFLQLQQQGPTWTCPICNKTISFEALAVDQYVADILKTVGRDVEQVTIEPDGQWTKGTANGSTPSKGESNGNNSINQADDDGDSDIVEISDIRVRSLKNEASSAFQTNPALNGHSSTSPAVGGSTPAPGTPSASSGRNSLSSKRPASAVIDLTLSDSDEEPVRPPKRHQHVHPFNLSNSVHAPSPASSGPFTFRLGSNGGIGVAYPGHPPGPVDSPS